MRTISNIEFYRTNAEVYIDRNDDTTYGDDCVMFSWDGLENNEEVLEAWSDFFDEEGIEPASKEKWMLECNRCYFN